MGNSKECALEVDFIQNLRDIVLARIRHSLKEENTLVDYFANLVFDFASNFQLNSIEEVPNKGKQIIYIWIKVTFLMLEDFLAESL